jgi:curved DNA-binding protein CbpA
VTSVSVKLGGSYAGEGGRRTSEHSIEGGMGASSSLARAAGGGTGVGSRSGQGGPWDEGRRAGGWWLGRGVVEEEDAMVGRGSGAKLRSGSGSRRRSGTSTLCRASWVRMRRKVTLLNILSHQFFQTL